ncbi:MAG: hypothetical protein ABI646_02930 [Acidobacteriota bacterium]
MSIGYSNYVEEVIAGPPALVLKWTSEVMRFYPCVLQLGLVLQRLVQ